MVAGLIFLVLPASYTFADGSHFEGTWKNFLPHGHGTYTWPDGTVFKGSFNEGQIHGEGELSQQPVGNLLYNERGPIPTTITYTGGFSNGCAGGKGIITFSLDEARTVRENTCTQFSGHFSKGAATGAGEFLYPASVETGQWSEGVYVAGSGNRSEATPEAQAKIRACYQAQLAKPVPWDGRPIDPGKEVLLVRGVAVKRLGKHQELGVQTSHDLLRLMQKQYTANGGKEGKDEKGNTVWTFGPAQVEIMEKLGMFKRSDFVVVTFENLESFPYSVLSYTWNDSKWRELVLALQKLKPGMLEEGEEEEFFWLDIFCLDQFKADKMKSIFRSNEIYGWAVKYYVMGLAIFDRVW